MSSGLKDIVYSTGGLVVFVLLLAVYFFPPSSYQEEAQAQYDKRATTQQQIDNGKVAILSAHKQEKYAYQKRCAPSGSWIQTFVDCGEYFSQAIIAFASTAAAIFAGGAFAAAYGAYVQTRRATRATERSQKGTCVVKVVKHSFEFPRKIPPPYEASTQCLYFEILNAGHSIVVIESLKGGGRNVASVAEYRIENDDWCHQDNTFQAILLPNEGIADGKPICYPIWLRDEDIPNDREGELYFAWLEIDYRDTFGYLWRATMTFRKTGNADGLSRGGITFGPLTYSESKIKA